MKQKRIAVLVGSLKSSRSGDFRSTTRTMMMRENRLQRGQSSGSR
jgi:hypothetical protein